MINHPTPDLISRFSPLVTSAIVIGLSSCTPSSPPAASSPSAILSSEEAPALQVVTTFLPITQFTQAVAGTEAQVTQLLPVNIGPHDYQAKPEDVQKLAQADVLVKNGLEMENFLTSLIQNAGNDHLKIIDSSQGIKTIATEEQDHDDHDHSHQSGHDHHAHGEFNPHIWLDPKRAIQQVENIRDGLIAVDPDRQETYSANATEYIQKLQQLDAEIEQKLKPYQGKTFVAFHDFAPYFAESYGLKVQSLVDVPEDNPSPDDMRKVSEIVKSTQLKTLLIEPQGGKAPFTALAKDLKIQVSVFDPLETGTIEAMTPDYYLQTMQENVNNLLTGFQADSPQSFHPGKLLITNFPGTEKISALLNPFPQPWETLIGGGI